MRASVRIRLEPVLERRPIPSSMARFGVAVLLALGIVALALLISGHSPATTFTAMIRGAFGSSRAWAATLNKAVPIGLAAIGIALASRAGLWNIGAEGQIYMGAFAATGVGFLLSDGTLPVVAVSLVLISGSVAGLVWGLIPAAAKAYLGVNEIISTLLLNYVAILWVNYLVFGPWADPATISFPFSEPLPDPALLPDSVGEVHLGFFIFLGAVLVLYMIDRGTRWGYEMRVFGDSPQAARFGGISKTWVILSGLAFAGALAGLAGSIEVAGVTSRLQEGLSPGYGFIAVLVAWVAGTRPLPILLASVVYAGLLNGAFALQVSGIPAAIATIVQASLLLAVLAAQSLGRYRLRVLHS